LTLESKINAFFWKFLQIFLQGRALNIKGLVVDRAVGHLAGLLYEYFIDDEPGEADVGGGKSENCG